MVLAKFSTNPSSILKSHPLPDFDLDCLSSLRPQRYSKLMGDEPDLDPDINKDFFENNVLQLDPSLLTENGMKCFERFFKAVNCREGKLVAKRRAYMMDDLELIGLDYLWRVRMFDRSLFIYFVWVYNNYINNIHFF